MATVRPSPLDDKILAGQTAAEVGIASDPDGLRINVRIPLTQN